MKVHHTDYEGTNIGQTERIFKTLEYKKIGGVAKSIPV